MITLHGKTPVALICAVLIFAVVAASPGLAQDETNEIRHLAQMPVAVSKLSAVGYPDRHLRKLAETLVDAEVSPRDFNLILRSVPFFTGAISSFKGVANYISLQHERGLNGEELVESVRSEVAGQNLPWKLMLPSRESYLGDRAKNILRRVRSTINQRRGREEGEPELDSEAKSPSPRRPGQPRPF